MATEGALTPPVAAQPKLTCVAHAWLSAPVYELLTIEASRRRQHPDALVAAIITTVLIDGVVDAVLDR